MIPEASVEAALYAWGFSAQNVDERRELLGRILEAAAPFIEEAAYGRGFDDGHLAGQESMEAE